MFHYPMNFQQKNVPYSGYPTPNHMQQLAPSQFPTQVQVPVPAGTQIPTNGMYPDFGPYEMPPGIPTPDATPQVMLPLEQSYIENILRLNLGKLVTIYMTFEYSPEWGAKVFRGILDEAGRDHIIIRDEETGKSYLLLMVNLDYVEFEESIEYVTPGVPSQLPTAPYR
jgi:spore germination protein Q